MSDNVTFLLQYDVKIVLGHQSDTFSLHFCSRSNLLQEGHLRKPQDSVLQQTSGRLPSVIADDSSELPAVIKMGWLDKNQPTG